MLFKNNKNDRQITVNCYKNKKIKKGNVSVNQKRYRKKFNGVATLGSKGINCELFTKIGEPFFSWQFNSTVKNVVRFENIAISSHLTCPC